MAVKNKKGSVPQSRKKPGAVPSTQVKSRERLFVFAILSISFIAFLPSLQNDFVNWDDYSYVKDNQLIRNLSATNLGYIFKTNTYIMGNYHPLTMLSYAIEYSLFKLQPFYYHLDNVLLHLLNVLLVYVFIRMLLEVKTQKPEAGKSELQSQPSSFLIAAITALLFGIHPLRVESVAWVSERKDVLYTLFFLGAMICYLQYVRKAREWESEKAGKAGSLPLSHFLTFSLSFLFFLASLLSKGQAVVLAPVLLLIDYFVKRKFSARVLIEKLPFFALALYFGIIAMHAQGTSVTDHYQETYTVAERFVIANYGILMYLYKLVLPINLSCSYQYPEAISGIYYLAPVGVAVLLFLLFKFARQKKAFVWGAAFFLVTVSIVLQFVKVGGSIISERYTYIPYIGLFFLTATIYSELLKNARLKIPLQVAGIIITVVLFTLTFNQAKTWKDSRTLWTSVLKNHPNESSASNGLGTVCFDEKQYEQALEYFDRAIASNKRNPYSYKNKGTVYRRLRKHDMATVFYKKSLEIWPTFQDAQFGLCGNYVDMGKPDSAVIYCDMATKEESRYRADAYYNKGVALQHLQRYKEAIESYTTAISINPQYATAYNNRANIYDIYKDYNSSLADYTMAINLDPSNYIFYFNRSIAYYAVKDYKSALDDALIAQSKGATVEQYYLDNLKAGR